MIVKSELRIRGALYFHCLQIRFPLIDPHLDLLALGALHLLGGKAALNRPTLLSQFLRFDILVITGIVSSVLTAPNRQFYWQYKRSEVAQRQPSCSVAGWQRFAWRCEACEDADIWRLRGEQLILNLNWIWNTFNHEIFRFDTFSALY